MLVKEKDETKYNYCSQYPLTEKYYFKKYFNDLQLLNKKVTILMHVDIIKSKPLLKTRKKNERTDRNNIKKGNLEDIVCMFLNLICIFVIFGIKQNNLNT